MQFSVHQVSVAIFVKAMHLATLAVVLPWAVVDDSKILVVSGAVVVVVMMVGLVVSGDAVLVSCKLVVMAKGVVVILSHWHNRAGQKGVT